MFETTNQLFGPNDLNQKPGTCGVPAKQLFPNVGPCLAGYYLYPHPWKKNDPLN